MENVQKVGFVDRILVGLRALFNFDADSKWNWWAFLFTWLYFAVKKEWELAIGSLLYLTLASFVVNIVSVVVLNITVHTLGSTAAVLLMYFVLIVGSFGICVPIGRNANYAMDVIKQLK